MTRSPTASPRSSAAGIELFMLQFQPLEAEVVRFGSEVIPRVRERSLSTA